MGHKATTYINTSVSCIEQSKANKNSTQNDLQQDFLQGLPQANKGEEEKILRFCCWKIEHSNYGMFEWMKECVGIKSLCD